MSFVVGAKSQPNERSSFVHVFQREPPPGLLQHVLDAFGIASLADKRLFTKADLEARGTVDAMRQLVPALMPCYYPTFARTYLTDLDVNRSVTVLRHMLRAAGRTLVGKEISVRSSTKLMLYAVRRKQEPFHRMHITKGGFTFDFHGHAMLADVLSASADASSADADSSDSTSVE